MVKYPRHSELWKAIRGAQKSMTLVDIETIRLEQAFSELRIEIDKLNSIIDELRDENERLKRASKGGEA